MPAGGVSFVNVTVIDSSKRPFAKFVDPAGFNDISGTFNVVNSEECNYYIAGPRTPGDINISCLNRAVKSDNQVMPSSGNDDFQAWQREFGIQYTFEASLHRFSIFQANLRRTAAQDEANRYAKFGLDEFADLTPDEFSQQMLSPELNAEFARHTQSRVDSDDSDGAHDSENVVMIDWRKKGVVTAVKNQGRYGTCWAFSATGVMQGVNAMQPGHALVALSEQYFIDCCGKQDNRSECVGSVHHTFNWEVEQGGGGLPTEASYPYNGSVSKCRAESATISAAHFANYTQVLGGVDGDQSVILGKLGTGGPACIGIDGACIQGYKGGVITNCTGKGINHAVLLVGAGTTSPSDGSLDYWLVKNSWGLKFGEAGYFRFQRDQKLLSMKDAWFGEFADTRRLKSDEDLAPGDQCAATAQNYSFFAHAWMDTCDCLAMAPQANGSFCQWWPPVAPPPCIASCPKSSCKHPPCFTCKKFDNILTMPILTDSHFGDHANTTVPMFAHALSALPAGKRSIRLSGPDQGIGCAITDRVLLPIEFADCGDPVPKCNPLSVVPNCKGTACDIGPSFSHWWGKCSNDAPLHQPVPLFMLRD
jgi:hypothetical protein